MTFLLLLMSLPSYLPCLRQHILGITPGLSFLGNPSRPRIRLIPAQLLTSTESVGRFTPVTVLLKKRAKWSTKDTEDQPFLSLLHRSLAWDERTRVTLRCERQERTVPQVDRVVLSKACCAPSALTGTQSPASDDNSRRRSRRSYDDIPWY
jgi:hypothetical protein